MSATSTERPSSSKTESKKQKSALSRGNTTQAQKSNQAASSTVITVAAGQRLMSIPEQSFGDETASNIRTPEGRQPEVQGPPPVEPGMGPPQRRLPPWVTAQPASSPMGGFAYSQVAAIERIQGGSTDPLTVRQQEKLPERRVSPAVSEQSRTSSRRLKGEGVLRQKRGYGILYGLPFRLLRIQELSNTRNANLAEAAAKIDEESNEDANAICCKKS
ncbi:hypothetical protein LENED_002478 [Lentinula edodes]|uniref:Uncharacterized protein n=1 Tax=Lentinula edodes TaxID=5353 RepID=A0A1Q3E1K3_LENED|nr:hypothetical protein LENED_002478 [Lentinula edodes]